MSVLDTGVARDVAHYAARVRAALADLGADQVDDLTDGLEANLADALADDGRAHGGGLVEEFGAPEAYAAELRAAAGLTPARPRHPVRDVLAGRWQEAFAIDDAVLAALRAKRGWLPVEELLVSLRPAWWVLRGWALAQLLLRATSLEPGGAWWLPTGPVGALMMLAVVVASVQWGRGRWPTRGRWHAVASALSVLGAGAAVVLLLWLPGAQQVELEVLRTAVAAAPQDGVVVDGERAENLFVYDADGVPVDGAQVVDQDGRPVLTEADAGQPEAAQYWDDGMSSPLYRVGAVGVDGRTRWNAYPLHSAPYEAFEWSSDGSWALGAGAADDLLAPRWPFARAGAVQVPGGDAAQEAAAPDPSRGSPAPDASAPGSPAPDAPAPGAPAPGAPVPDASAPTGPVPVPADPAVDPAAPAEPTPAG